MIRTVALLAALLAVLAWHRRPRRTEPEPDPGEYVPMAAWWPQTLTVNASTDPPTVTTLAHWRN